IIETSQKLPQQMKKRCCASCEMSVCTLFPHIIRNVLQEIIRLENGSGSTLRRNFCAIVIWPPPFPTSTHVHFRRTGSASTLCIPPACLDRHSLQGAF